MRHQYRQFHSQAVLITKAGAGVDSGRKGEAAKLSFVAIFRLGRDGGTGRRSGLKIRRGLSPRGGSTPPPRTKKNLLQKVFNKSGERPFNKNNGLKIRRGLSPRGGSTPPPGTKKYLLQHVFSSSGQRPFKKRAAPKSGAKKISSCVSYLINFRRSTPTMPRMPEPNSRMLLGSGTGGPQLVPQVVPVSVNASEGIEPRVFS